MKKHKSFVIKIDNTELERVKKTKFLGIILDQNLTWSEQISYISDKISKTIGVMYKIRPHLNRL